MNGKNTTSESIFLSINREEIITSIVQFVNERNGIFVLTGRKGTGKSFISKNLDSYFENTKIVLINKIYLNEEDFLKDICKELDIKTSDSSIIDLLLNRLHSKLKSYYKENINVLIIIDNIDEYENQIIDLIIKISEFEYQNNKLSQIMLISDYKGIELIKQKENEYEELLFNIIFDIKNFTLQETINFIKKIFKENNILILDNVDNESALELVYDITKGNPGKILRLFEHIFLTMDTKKFPNSNIIIESARQLGFDIPEKTITSNKNTKIIPLIIGLLIVIAIIVYFSINKEEQIIVKKQAVQINKTQNIKVNNDNQTHKIIEDNNSIVINDNLSKTLANNNSNNDIKNGVNLNIENNTPNIKNQKIIQKCVQLKKNLNFRTKPSLTAERITVLSSNTNYKILENNGLWLKIQYKSQQGWIYNSPNFVEIYNCD